MGPNRINTVYRQKETMNNLPEGIDRMEYEAPTYRPIEKYRWTGNMEFRPYSVSTNRSRQVWTDQFKYDS